MTAPRAAAGIDAGADAGADAAGAGAVGLAVTEFTDPLCPWAWGSEPVLRRLRYALGHQASWRRVFGILFDEDDDPAPDPAAETRWYAGFVEEVSGHTGAPRAARLERVGRSSWPASLAAKAAERQGERVADLVLRRLRESMFLLGDPADTGDRALAALTGVPGLDAARLRDDVRAPATREAVRRDWAETRRPAREVLGLDAPGPHPGAAKTVGDHRRYALPTLRLTGPGGTAYVPGWRPYPAYLAAVRQVAPDVLANPAPQPPDAALERHRTLTAPELACLTGADAPPSRAVRLAAVNGPVWFHPDELRGHPAAERLAP